MEPILEAALSRADSSLGELCGLLNYRAEKAKRMLDHSVVEEFDTLHVRHIDALRTGQLVLAHYILDEIQEFIAIHDPGKHIHYFEASPKRTQLTYGEEYFLSGGFLGLLLGSSLDREDCTPEAIASRYSGLAHAIKDELHGS
jgi:hypothetical protein